jgi:predicted Zn-dependent protease
MRAIGVLTINAELENDEDFVKTVEDARDYFLAETWAGIQYLGALSLKHDVKVATKEESRGALLLDRLFAAVRKVKENESLVTLVLGITPDPVIALHYFFDGTNFKRASYLVHDYVAEQVGVVSLFQVEEDSLTKVVAHGLGHSRGLRHHAKPIDLMYPELLRVSAPQVDGFCEACMRKLKTDQTDVLDSS